MIRNGGEFQWELLLKLYEEKGKEAEEPPEKEWDWRVSTEGQERK